jgi:hypothetical protein
MASSQCVEHAEMYKKLARNQRGHKTLGEMPEPIEMIAVPMEDCAKPVEERFTRISVVPPNAKQANVKRNQGVAKSREAEPPVGGSENDKTDHTGKSLQPPR